MAKRTWFRIEPVNKADDGEGEKTSADIHIYAEIGDSWFGDSVSANDMVALLTDLDVDELNVFINSPGGAAWDGIAIMNALRRHRATVNVTVDGLAASAASIIAMAGDHITMNTGSEMMIHRASGLAWGNEQTMQDTAAILAKLDTSLSNVYQARAGKTSEHWLDLMAAESWFTAEEAVEAGLADEWADAPAVTAAFDMSRFKFAARAQAPAPHLTTHTPPSSTEPVDNQKKEITVSDTLKAGLLERLGVTDADASEETLLAALDEALDERAETPVAKAPEGTVLVDSAQFESLQADAAAGREARNEQNKARREGVVNRAMEDGRISAANRQTWLDQLEANEEGTTALINSLPKNVVPVVEIGHSDDTLSAEDSAYASAWGDDDETES